jgi:hypothetical protein
MHGPEQVQVALLIDHSFDCSNHVSVPLCAVYTIPGRACLTSGVTGALSGGRMQAPVRPSPARRQMVKNIRGMPLLFSDSLTIKIQTIPLAVLLPSFLEHFHFTFRCDSKTLQSQQ